MARAELGNLTVRILHPPRRMSTVEIRAGSLICTSLARNGARGAGPGEPRVLFPTSSTNLALPSQDVHRLSAFPPCAKSVPGCKVEVERIQSS